MKNYKRPSRSFTLMEMLTVVSLLGTFFLLSGPLTLHLIYAIHGRTETYNQLFLVSRIGDKVRSDLQNLPDGQQPSVLAVKPDYLRIDAAGKQIEYRIDGTEIERSEFQNGKSRTTAIWDIPHSSLTFSRQQGKDYAVLVELHWRLGRPGERFTQACKTRLEMAFATREPIPNKEENET